MNFCKGIAKSMVAIGLALVSVAAQGADTNFIGVSGAVGVEEFSTGPARPMFATPLSLGIAIMAGAIALAGIIGIILRRRQLARTPHLKS